MVVAAAKLLWACVVCFKAGFHFGKAPCCNRFLGARSSDGLAGVDNGNKWQFNIWLRNKAAFIKY